MGSDSKKAQVDRIIKELKTEGNHRALFNRAKNAGEDVKEVDYALRQLILNIHTQQKKRGNESTRTPKYNLLPFNTTLLRTHTLLLPLGLAASITPTPNQGPTTTDQHSSEARHEPSSSTPRTKRMVLVYVNDESMPEMFTLSKEISTESEAASGSSTPQLSVLKANIEQRLAPRLIDLNRLKIEMDGMQMKCIHQEVFAFVCAEAERQRHITLRGLRAVSTLHTTNSMID